MSLVLVRRVTVASLAAALALVVAGCGGDDDPAASPSSASTADTATDAPSETTEPSSEATAPPTPAPTETPSAPPSDVAPGAGADTTEAAIARFEEYLHALGNKDIPTLCEIAGPAAKVAEDEGFGPCETTYAMVVEMPSPEQLTALQTATVDPALVDDSTPGQVTIPLEAVVASATFGAEELGDSTLAYQDGNWFIVE